MGRCSNQEQGTGNVRGTVNIYRVCCELDVFFFKQKRSNPQAFEEFVDSHTSRLMLPVPGSPFLVSGYSGDVRPYFVC